MNFGIKFDTNQPCRCDNCGGVFDFDELQMIDRLYSRIEAGGMVPAGQCPDCQALAYPIPEPAPLPETPNECAFQALSNAFEAVKSTRGVSRASLDNYGLDGEIIFNANGEQGASEYVLKLRNAI